MRECYSSFDYLKFICGEDDGKGCEKFIRDHYLVVGILEEFEKTLALFEKYLPDYFTGAIEISKKLTDKFETTETFRYKKMTHRTRKFLENGLLKKENQIYQYIRSLFYQHIM